MAIVSISNGALASITLVRLQHDGKSAAAAARSRECNAWSIDDEPMGSGWHESSWMLRKGLDVIEGAPAHLWPAEWLRAWQ